VVDTTHDQAMIATKLQEWGKVVKLARGRPSDPYASITVSPLPQLGAIWWAHPAWQRPSGGRPSSG